MNFNRTVFFLTVLLIASTLGALAHAQNSSSQARKFVTIIQHEVPIYGQPSDGAPPIAQGNFAESHPLLGSPAGYLKIRLSDGREGYVKDVLDEVMATRETEFIQAESKSTRLYNKALIVKADTQRSTDKVTPLHQNFYGTAALSGVPRGNVTIFEVRYIYARASGAILLGKADSFNSRTSKDVLEGWIKEDYVREWDNRVGLEFNKENFSARKRACGLGEIYFDQADLLRGGPKFEEPDVEAPYDYYFMRYPLLKASAVKNGLSPAVETYTLLHLGNIKTSGREFKPEDLFKASHAIEDFMRSKGAQMVVLIDATRGMERHMPNVKKALEELLADDKNTRVAVAVYRDWPDDNGGLGVFEVVADFNTPHQTLLARIEQITANSSPNDVDRPMPGCPSQHDGMYPEAMFQGIHKALSEQKLKWGDGERYVVLIGDHGNHECDQQYPQEKDYTINKTIDILRRKRAQIFAVQVNVNDQSKKVYLDLFKTQVSRLISDNEGLGSQISAEDNSLNKIRSALASVVSSLVQQQQAIDQFLNGYQSYGGLGEKVLRHLGVDPQLYSGQQLTKPGFARVTQANCSHPQFKQMVLMERDTLERLKSAMMEVRDAMRDWRGEASVNRFQSAVVRAVEALTGEKMSSDENNVAQFIEKRTGIPVQTQYLKASLSTLVDRARNPEEMSAFAKELDYKIFVLGAIGSERGVEIREGWSEAGGLNANWTSERVRYFFDLTQRIQERRNLDSTTDSRRRHAWIPLSAIP